MTQEEEDLVLKDICDRLPSWVKVSHNGVVYVAIGYAHGMIELCNPFSSTTQWVDIVEIKPYLRPMSSMTEEESAELSNIINEWFDKELFYLTEEPFLEYALSKINYSINLRLFDWLNKNMFDCRGLIPKGHAIEVTKENNPYKK